MEGIVKHIALKSFKISRYIVFFKKYFSITVSRTKFKLEKPCKYLAFKYHASFLMILNYLIKLIFKSNAKNHENILTF